MNKETNSKGEHHANAACAASEGGNIEQAISSGLAGMGVSACWASLISTLIVAALVATGANLAGCEHREKPDLIIKEQGEEKHLVKPKEQLTAGNGVIARSPLDHWQPQ